MKIKDIRHNKNKSTSCEKVNRKCLQNNRKIITKSICLLIVIFMLTEAFTDKAFAFSSDDGHSASISDNSLNNEEKYDNTQNEKNSDYVLRIEEIDENILGDDEINWDDYFEYGENNTEIIEYHGPFYKVVIPAKVTSIAENAFDKKKRIVQSIKFEKGSNCTQIGNSVFKDCTLLSEVVLPDSLESVGDEAFSNTALRKVHIPDSVKYIGSKAYYGNEGLTEVRLGKGVVDLGMNAFANCSKLKNLEFLCTNLANECKGVFDGCILNNVSIGENVECIADGLFESASFANKSTIILPNTIISIGKRAFANAKNLNIGINGDRLIEIRESAFEGSDVKILNFPASLSTVGNAAFKDCVHLTEFTVPANTLSLGEEAFKGCTNLARVYMSDKIIRIGKECFADCSKDLTIYTYADSYADSWAKKNKINVIYACKIIYKLRKGINNQNNPIMYIPGENKSFLEPYRAGYEFLGWYKDSTSKEEIKSTADCKGKLKVYANWAPISYSVKYILNGDSVNNKANEKRTVRTVKKPYVIKKAKRKGYNFKGWYTNPEFDGEPIKKIPRTYADDIILYAKWEEYTYNILFDANGGVVSQYASDEGILNPFEKVRYTESVTLPGKGAMDKRMWQGYVYTGWNTLPEGNLKNKKGVHFDLGQKVAKLQPKNNSKIVLYAEWTPVEYNVTYVLNGGINNSDNPVKHTVDKSVSLKKPEKPGCNFAGWYLDSDYNIRVRKISKNQPSDITLYAKWK